MTATRTAVLAAVLLAGAGCAGKADSGGGQAAATASVTIAGAGGSHRFAVERAATPAQQERGLMYRTDLKPDGGMLFYPYPAEGGPPREASFWMKNTPTPLDIIFVRPDKTIARIAENTVPFSEEQVRSGEPVNCVLELVGGRTAALGIAEGDRLDCAAAAK